jgi:hypothetical protein
VFLKQRSGLVSGPSGVQRFEALQGDDASDFGRENAFVLLAAISIAYQIAAKERRPMEL